MTAGPLRVQVHAADLGGCGHYRVIWPAETLAVADPQLEVELLGPNDAGEAFRASVDLAGTIAAHGPDTVARMQAGTFNPRDTILGGLHPDSVPAADVVVLQRPLTAHLVQIIPLLQRRGIAVVVETDDDFETIDRRNIAHATVDPAKDRHRNYLHLRAAADLADLVTVTTPALAKRYGAHGRVAVIPNYVPTRYLHTIAPPRPAGDQTVRVGWSGSLNTHPGDLETVAGPVAAVLARHRLTFHHIGEPDQARMRQALALPDAVPYATTGEWLPLGQYPAAMALLDIGIVPLRLSPFNEAKSWLKGLEFAAVGVPFIASPTGPYRQLAEEHGIGLVAGSRRDWRTLLDRLIVDADYRYELGEQNRARARALTLEPNTHQWANAWHQAAANRKANA